jgi:hypothetical protein
MRRTVLDMEEMEPCGSIKVEFLDQQIGCFLLKKDPALSRGVASRHCDRRKG